MRGRGAAVREAHQERRPPSCDAAAEVRNWWRDGLRQGESSPAAASRASMARAPESELGIE